MTGLKIIAVLFFFPTIVFTQGGYFGAKNSLEIEVHSRPTLSKTYRMNDAGTKTITRNRFSYTSYALNYSHVFNKNVELTFGYRFAKAYSPLYLSLYLVPDTIYTSDDPEYISYKDLNFLEDPCTKLHFFSVEVKYYLFGSIAPLGKYFGFEFEYGIGNFLESDDIYVGKGNTATTDNFLFKSQDIIELDTIHVPADINAKVSSFNILLGRSHPINDFLLLTLGVKFPLLSIITVNNIQDLGIGAQKVQGFNYTAASSFRQILWTGLGKFTRVSFSFGIKIAF